MRFTTLIPAFCILMSGVSATAPVDLAVSQMALNITATNCYGAPKQCGEEGSYPGWYYGNSWNAPEGLACLVGFLGELLCELLRPILGCSICPVGPIPPATVPSPPPIGGKTPPPPPPPKGYNTSYTNLTCATEVWPPQDYLTYGCVDSIQACANMCDTIKGCAYFNSFRDLYASPQKCPSDKCLTCSLFTDNTLTAANAINCGGQQQQPPPAPKTCIEDSYAYSKPKPT
ncbi:hypothetical protein C8R46DRAFT_1030017 [Mycena filopes]|nr:hypothetical protein C8R46DRAFT_1030017 [Mycena filopes]